MGLRKTVEALTGALLGVAVNQASGSLDSLLPGFHQEFTKVRAGKDKVSPGENSAIDTSAYVTTKNSSSPKPLTAAASAYESQQRMAETLTSIKTCGIIWYEGFSWWSANLRRNIRFAAVFSSSGPDRSVWQNGAFGVRRTSAVLHAVADHPVQALADRGRMSR